MSFWTNLADSFGGNGGSQAQGTPTTSGAGDGDKGNQITSWLNRVTGVYSAFSGTRSNAVGATTPNTQPPKPPYALYAVIAAAAGVLLWFAFKKH